MPGSQVLLFLGGGIKIAGIILSWEFEVEFVVAALEQYHSGYVIMLAEDMKAHNDMIEQRRNRWKW